VGKSAEGWISGKMSQLWYVLRSCLCFCNARIIPGSVQDVSCQDQFTSIIKILT